jgi:hypothetical protein
MTTWGARWARFYSALVVVLSAIVGVLLVAVAFRYGVISASTLVANKDLIDAGTKLIGAIVLVFGAIASYFRFFKGRTLSPRLMIAANVEVFPIDEARNLHVLSVEVKNVGSVAVWGLEPRVEIRFHGGQERTEEDVAVWRTPLEEIDGKKRIHMLDTDESSQFVVHRSVPAECWAVTYFARVGLSSGHSWHRIVTASNRVVRSGR